MVWGGYEIFFRWCLRPCSVLPALFRRQLRLIITVEGIPTYYYRGHYYRYATDLTIDIAIAGTTIGTGPGLSA